MMGLTRRWVRREVEGCGAGGGPASGVVPPLVQRVLAARGRVDPAEVRAFCFPSLKQMHEPSLMAGLDRAAERILEALDRDEPVVIYGDYDVDGVCAAAILFHVMRAISPRGNDAKVSTYVPHRLDEGYGLHVEAMDALAREGARLVVSVDCGVTGFAAAARAAELGMDLIITDHHNLPAAELGLPGAVSVVHPRLAGSAYPCGELCGAGVAFKLAWRLATMRSGSERADDRLRAVLIEMLGLAALGTIADVVPLSDENRVIAKFGLDQLKRSRLTGVRALIEASGLDGEEIDSERAGFALAPRLNACGRMGHARAALEMLTTADAPRAAAIPHELNRHNTERRATEKRIFDEACELAEARGMTGVDRRAIVLSDARWHAGVVGIVCSRLIGKYHRPTFLLARDSETSHGSGRSIDGFDLHAGLSACSDLLEKFGGHEMAAGLVVRNDRFDAFAERFTAYAGERVTEEMLTAPLGVDCEARVEELTVEAVRQLAALGPFGRGNPRPCVVLRGLTVVRDARAMGSNGAHMNVEVAAPGSRGPALRLVGWSWGERREHLRAGTRLDVAIHPSLNAWNGTVSVQGELCDVMACAASGAERAEA